MTFAKKHFDKEIEKYSTEPTKNAERIKFLKDLRDGI